MRNLVILGLLAVIAVTGAAPPLARRGRKPSYKASFPPLGQLNHNVIHVANVDGAPGAQAFPDIELLPNLGPNIDAGERALESKKPVFQMDPECKTKGVSASVCDLVLKKLAVANFAPFDRLEYFAPFNREHLTVVGWTGYVEAFTHGPKGLMIQVRLTPQLRQMGVVAPVTLDAFTEFYLLDKTSKLTYVGGQFHQRAFRESLMEF